MTKNVVVYMADWCPWCHKVMDFLDVNKIPFKKLNVDQEKNAEEVIKKSGQSGIPVTDIGGQIIVGFDVKKLKELLEIK